MVREWLTGPHQIRWPEDESGAAFVNEDDGVFYGPISVSVNRFIFFHS